MRALLPGGNVGRAGVRLPGRSETRCFQSECFAGQAEELAGILDLQLQRGAGKIQRPRDVVGKGEVEVVKSVGPSLNHPIRRGRYIEHFPQHFFRDPLRPEDLRAGERRHDVRVDERRRLGAGILTLISPVQPLAQESSRRCEIIWAWNCWPPMVTGSG